MALDPAPLSVLFIGGTGTISASSVRLAVASGMTVHVLNRGNNSAARDLPDEVVWLTGDVTDDASLAAALGDRHFDAVVNFLSYDAPGAQRMVDTFTGRTGHYLHISTASLYGKPVLKWPITESTQLHNRFVKYSRDKLDAEHVLFDAFAEKGFPVTIIRPSHTYDDHNPPLPGGWTVIDQMTRGEEVVVPGDGTSLWTLTHAEDFALGLVGLLGNTRAIGEAFHITGDDVFTWDQIYTIIADALGVEAKLVHVPSELISAAAPDWFWSELIIGDLSHSAVFDNSKIRSFVPSFRPSLTFNRAAVRMMAWRAANPELTKVDASTDEVLKRLVKGYHLALDAFTSLAPSK
ncbi:NAD-dependent epimerase/dehydratase family protein [Amnibacterium flavum]|uniref:Nucleotide sugar epimerase n=1 Tax=Amnibacterium flavum TaxID=2173173 RepID=A0A2V1HWY7_9MICO|nr:NAD-dependent epimerase/dehydratase family protein [Amnibacterium flavum]PVZ95759.1 nucleotide sugar epimerase [Amnibacterium flavum]